MTRSPDAKSEPRAVSRRPDVAAAGALLATGIAVAWYSRRLPYWLDVAPGPGFFPMWLGVLLALVAAFELFLIFTGSPSASTSDSQPEEAAFTRRMVTLGVLSVAVALLVKPLGFVVATGVFVAAAGWILDPGRRAANAVAAITIPFSVWLLFSVWLGVPLPRGPFGF